MLAEAGVTLVGENRAQDLDAKAGRAPASCSRGTSSATCRAARSSRSCRSCATIHSVGQRVGARAARPPRRRRTREVLVEVNIAGEEGKGGVDPGRPGRLPRALRAVGVPVAGLMTMPPLAAEPEDSRRWFAALRELAAAPRPARSCRWAPRRTSRSPSRRARRSCGSARRSYAAELAGEFACRDRRNAVAPRHGLPRLLASRARLLRPGRGARRATTTTSPTTRARGGARGALPRAPERAPPRSAPPPRRVRRHLRRRRARRPPTDACCARSAAGAPATRATATSACTSSSRSRSTTPSRSPTSSRTRSRSILNLQGADTDLSKRLIDFASGLTYALDGGMQRIADKVFMLTPRNVEISAEERARLIEKGFFNQS